MDKQFLEVEIAQLQLKLKELNNKAIWASLTSFLPSDVERIVV